MGTWRKMSKADHNSSFNTQRITETQPKITKSLDGNVEKNEQSKSQQQHAATKTHREPQRITETPAKNTRFPDGNVEKNEQCRSQQQPKDKGIPGGSRWSTRLSRSRCSVIFLQVFSCSWGLQSAVAQLDRCYHRTISWVAPCPLKTSDAKDPDRIAGFCEDRWLKILSLKRCWKQLTQRNLTE